MSVVNRIKRLIPSNVKQIIKSIPIPITKNQKYDLYTQKLIRDYLESDSNCVDVGCYKGEILDLFLKYCKNGNHIAFEPTEINFTLLKEKYNGYSNVEIYNQALSDKIGTEEFHFVTSNHSYSGFKKRKYEAEETVDIIQVNTTTLDNVSIDRPINLIKIDVEGAESLVIKGAINTIKKYKPILIFEHGIGGSELYGSTNDLYNIFEMLEYKIFTFESFFKRKLPFSKSEFQNQFDNGVNHYFVASA